MPHLLVERLRELPKACDCACVRSKYFPLARILVETLDLIAGIIFTIGSFCFLPEYANELIVFLAGCVCFVVGGLIFLVISLYTLTEALLHYKSLTFEVFENVLYVLGAWFFVVGTILYWPKKSHYEHIELMKSFAWGQYFNLYSPEFEGTVLFTLGSVLFAFAAFTNALNHRRFEQEMSQMLTAVTSLYMASDMLFIIGSIAFLPDLGCNEKMLAIGAWCFIIGSLLFIVGAAISMYRTLRLWRLRERTELLSKCQEGPGPPRA